MSARLREAVILLAVPGEVRVARGLVSRAIRRVLGAVPHGTAPRYLHYFSTADLVRDVGASGATVTPRYQVHVSEDELARIERAFAELGEEAGVEAPHELIEVYHD